MHRPLNGYCLAPDSLATALFPFFLEMMDKLLQIWVFQGCLVLRWLISVISLHPSSAVIWEVCALPLRCKDWRCRGVSGTTPTCWTEGMRLPCRQSPEMLPNYSRSARHKENSDKGEERMKRDKAWVSTDCIDWWIRCRKLIFHGSKERKFKSKQLARLGLGGPNSGPQTVISVLSGMTEWDKTASRVSVPAFFPSPTC